MEDILTLDALRKGEHAQVLQLRASGAMRRRLLDLGIVEGTRIECVGRSPFGDPSAYLVRGAVIALRSCDGARIILRRCGGGHGAK